MAEYEQVPYPAGVFMVVLQATRTRLPMQKMFTMRLYAKETSLMLQMDG